MSRLQRLIPIAVVASLLATLFGVFGAPWLDAFAVLSRLRPLPALAVVALGGVQVLILSERWRAWEKRAGQARPALHALEATAAGTLIATSFGPFAGDLARGVHPDGLRVRGIAADRAVNSVLAMALGCVAFAPLVWSLPAVALSLAALFCCLGRTSVTASLLTLIVFASIAVQVHFAALALNHAIALPELLHGIPTLLVASLVPVSLLGVGGKELSLPWVFAGLPTDVAIAMGALLAAASLLGPAMIYATRRLAQSEPALAPGLPRPHCSKRKASEPEEDEHRREISLVHRSEPGGASGGRAQ